MLGGSFPTRSRNSTRSSGSRDLRLKSRRTFIKGIASGFAIAPLTLAAQPTSKVYRLGYLSIGSASGTYTRPIEAFRQGLHELGWDEGRNLIIEYRFAEGRSERLRSLADELVQRQVDIIVASPTNSAMAAKDATRTTPIVAMSLTEPVAVGLVASLARPGGNITGLTYGVDKDIFGKQLQLLKEVIPDVRRVARAGHQSQDG